MISLKSRTSHNIPTGSAQTMVSCIEWKDNHIQAFISFTKNAALSIFVKDSANFKSAKKTGSDFKASFWDPLILIRSLV